jgi:hypothetical protein
MKIQIALCSLLFLLISCGNPVKVLKKEIKKSGHILYQNPLSHAGTGTLIGGPPKQMMVVADPQTCYPDEVDYVSTGLRRSEGSVLPNKYRNFNFDIKASADFLDMIANSGGLISAGVGFNMVHNMEVTFEDVTIEYIDSVRLYQFYNLQMDPICKDFLDQVGFIIQAIKIGKMSIKLYNKYGNNIELNVPVLESVFNLDVGLDWSLENRSSLVINSPHYVGFQLGKLTRSDGGMVLQRAAKTRGNKYVFQDVSTFAHSNLNKSSRRALSKHIAPLEGFLQWSFQNIKTHTY